MIRDIGARGRPRYIGRVGDGRRRTGAAAEAAAAAFLERAGLRVVERNVRFSHGEIDLVCRDGDVLVFVEVKSRRAHWDDGPAAAVSGLKQWRLTRLARHYLKWRRLGEPRCRFDVVAVTTDGADAPTVRHLRGAFDAVDR
jgi:putative endonuclease